MRKFRSIAENRAIKQLTGYQPGTIGARQGIKKLSGYEPGTIGGERYIKKAAEKRTGWRDLGEG